MLCVPSCFIRVRLLVTLWTVAHQAPLSMGFPRQEYYSGLPFPFPWDHPDPGMDPVSLTSLALAMGWFFTISVTWQVLRQTIGNGYRQLVKENWAWVSEETVLNKRSSILHLEFGQAAVNWVLFTSKCSRFQNFTDNFF